MKEIKMQTIVLSVLFIITFYVQTTFGANNYEEGVVLNDSLFGRIHSKPGKSYVYRDMRRLIGKNTRGWIVKDLSYEDGTAGELLETSGLDITPITIPLKLNGYFKVYIGYASGTEDTNIKKYSDKEYIKVFSDSSYSPKDSYGEQYLYEKLAFVSNFLDEPIIIDAHYYDTTRIVYIKLIGATKEEIKLLNTADEGTKTNRVIYDNDGYSSFSDGIFPNSASLDCMLAKPLAEKNVGILNWCLGTTGLLNYSSNYAGEVFASFDKYPHQLRNIDKKAREQVVSIAKEGKSPLEFLAGFGEEKSLHVFASLRMNAFYPEDRYGFLNGIMYSSYKDVKQRDDNGLSYLYPKTRDYILNVLKESANFKNVDGVTLDYCRYPLVITSETDLATKVKVMNNFMRKVRKEIPNKTISVRVPYNNYSDYGYDIKTWIEEELVDILIPSNITKDDFFDIKPFVKMVKGTKTKLYIGICADVKGHDLTKEEESLIKYGLYVHTKTYLTINEYMKRAGEIYKSGGDGIFMFNTPYSIYISNNSPKEASLLGDKIAMLKWYTFQYNPDPIVKKIYITK